MGISLWVSCWHSMLTMVTCTPACSVAQSCPTLCNPMDCSPPGFSILGILQARILEWVAISSSRGSSQPRDQIHVSCVSCIPGEFFTSEAPGKPLYTHHLSPSLLPSPPQTNRSSHPFSLVESKLQFPLTPLSSSQSGLPCSFQLPVQDM